MYKDLLAFLHCKKLDRNLGMRLLYRWHGTLIHIITKFYTGQVWGWYIHVHVDAIHTAFLHKHVKDTSQDYCITGATDTYSVYIYIYIYIYTHVAVPGRSQTLFRCVFRLHYCIWNTLAWNFPLRAGLTHVYALCPHFYEPQASENTA